MPVLRLGLRDHDGIPEVLPIVAARVDATLWSPIDGKPKKNPQLSRLERLRRAPQVMLLCDYYNDDWADLWWLRLKAKAEVVVGKHPDWGRAQAALRRKYPQYEHTTMLIGEPTMVCFRWHALSWWSAGGVNGVTNWVNEHAAT